VNFVTAADATTSSAGARETTFAARDARWVRITGPKKAPSGISFWTVSAFGPAD
jgi:hypothetical protein